jgi:hypothetical protein
MWHESHVAAHYKCMAFRVSHEGVQEHQQHRRGLKKELAVQFSPSAQSKHRPLFPSGPV